VARKQLLALGLTPEAIDRRMAAGRLRPVHRGVYAVGHDALPLRGRLVAALLVAGPNAALSHGTAAALWKLTPSMPPFIELTTTTRAPRPRPGLRFYTTTAPDIRTRDGLPLTSPLRTLKDLAATRVREDVEDACSEALYLRLVPVRALTEQSGPGAAKLRAIAADAAPTRSRLERALRPVLKANALPAPEVNARLGRYRPDFLWRAHRTVVETDGFKAHGHRLAFERDRARDAALQAAGYAALRFTWRQVRENPQQVAQRIAGTLRLRAPRTAA
jgi:very-short-patch-repair endonuclease